MAKRLIWLRASAVAEIGFEIKKLLILLLLIMFVTTGAWAGYD